jgi:hypothetical protein
MTTEKPPLQLKTKPSLFDTKTLSNNPSGSSNRVAAGIAGIFAHFCRSKRFPNYFMAFVITCNELGIRGNKLQKLYNVAGSKLRNTVAAVLAANTGILTEQDLNKMASGRKPEFSLEATGLELCSRLWGFRDFYISMLLLDGAFKKAVDAAGKTKKKKAKAGPTRSNSPKRRGPGGEPIH